MMLIIESVEKRGIMRHIYKAHINENTGEIQTVKEHSENTADLCRQFAVPVLKEFMYITGLLHDVGKFQEGFQHRIDREKIRVEHSTCGAIVAKELYPDAIGLMMEYCIADAREKGKSGICMLGAKKQKNWLSNQAFAKKYGFETVDVTDNGYELLALSFDGQTPKFTENAKKEKIMNQELTIYYDTQCPYIYEKIEDIRQYCESDNIPVSLIVVDSLQKAKELPCVFNNWGAFYQGQFITVNLLDVPSVQKILKKGEQHDGKN